VPRSYRSRRSCHIVPATRPRMMQRAAQIDADEIVIDLEDSVAESAKADGSARLTAAEALAGGLFAAPTVAVRVSPVTSPHCHRDVTALVERAGDRLDVVVVPKVADAGHVGFVAHLLTALEGELGLPEGRIGIEAQIESAAGMRDVEAIAAANPERLEALVFGAGDYAASLRMPHTTIGAPLTGHPGEGWHYPLSRIVVAARANDLLAIDGPWVTIDDEEGLRRSALASRSLGFDGKWSIHPTQVAPLNEVYGVSQIEFDRAVDILGAHDRAATEGHGAVALDGEMVDEATRRLAETVLARGRLAGMERSPF
jgi:citrate lyase subunit beta / citryl-CoA lyase